MAKEQCPGCMGSGAVAGFECKICEGEGWVTDHSHFHRHGDVVHAHPHEHDEGTAHPLEKGEEIPHEHEHAVIHEHEHRHGNIKHSHPHAHEPDEAHDELHQHYHMLEGHEHVHGHEEQDAPVRKEKAKS
jgi:hypothetical protein